MYKNTTRTVGMLGWLLRTVALCSCLLLTQCIEPIVPPCQSDADCVDGQVCVAAGCVTKSTCPDRCVKHDDCIPCSSDRRFCINGACSPLPPTCPEVCAVNADCSPCGQNRTTCNEGRCVRAPDCPDSCKSDKECIGCGEQICFKGSCSPKAASCPASCGIDRDCTACSEGFRACIAGVCSAESAVCENDSQCSDGEKCIWKACTKDQIVGRKCNGACPVGFVCLYGYCFQSCQGKPNACANNTKDGRVLCTTLTLADRGRVSVCVGVADAGQLCEYTSFNTPRQAFCRNSLSTPLFCNSEGVCEKAVVQREVGASCHKRTDTRAKDEPLRICDQLSNPPLACDNTKGKGTCVKAVKAKVGMPCDETGLALDVPTLCDGSSVCISLYTPYIEGRCFETCTTDGSFPCADKRFRCYPYSYDRTRGVCLQAQCTKNEDCSFKDYECRFDGIGAQVCLPPVPSGGQGYGQLCGAKACSQGLQCLPSSNSNSGFCTKPCVDQASCPSVTSNSTTFQSLCYTIGADGAQQRCLVQCKQRKCPEGLNCFEFTGRNGKKNLICLP